VLDYEFESPVRPWPECGAVATGHIDLRDHGDAVGYRNRMIKVLPIEQADERHKLRPARRAGI